MNGPANDEVPGDRPINKRLHQGKFVKITKSVFLQPRMACAVLTSMLCMMPSFRVQAQEAAPAAASGGLEEIIVTARRRDEREQSVPMSVSVLSGADLAKNSVVRLGDLTRAVPAIQIVPSAFSANTPKFTIRSQSEYEPLLTADPSVTVYFADVVQERAHGLNAQLFDLASVEVLKGPQGTLFGRNSTGGDILLVPQPPTKDFDVQVDLSVGNYGLTTFNGILNVPVNEVLQLRFDGGVTRRRGYTRDLATGVDLDDAHNEVWRVGALFTPTDTLKNTLFVSGFKADEHGTGFQMTGNDPAGLQALAWPAAQGYLQQQQASDFHTVLSEVTPSDKVRTTTVANTTEWSPGSVTLKNIFGYRKVSAGQGFDFDGTPLPIFPSHESLDSKQFSDELQLLGTAIDHRLDWIGGLYWFKETGTEQQIATLNYAPYLTQNSVQTGDVTNISDSVFAQGTYHLESLSTLSFTGGARYTRDKRELTTTAIFNGACGISLDNAGTIPANPCYGSASKTFSSPTWQVGVDWQITPDKLLYLNQSRGYKSGGFNLRAQTPAQFTPFNPETVTQEELGLKADWHPGETALRTNVAIYYQSYNDIQRTQATIINGGLVTTIVNAATATVKGAEADITWLPIKELELRAYWAYSDAGYTKWLVPNGDGTFADNSHMSFSYAPKNSGGASVRASFPLNGDAGTLMAGIDGYHQSEIQEQDINVVPYGIARGYTVGNLRFEWQNAMASGVSAALFVRNFANAKYYLSGTPIVGLGSTVMTLGAPLTYGLELHYRLKH
jgi:iron complex outermembrane receptor protein